MRQASAGGHLMPGGAWHLASEDLLEGQLTLALACLSEAARQGPWRRERHPETSEHRQGPVQDQAGRVRPQRQEPEVPQQAQAQAQAAAPVDQREE
jgi:hypothetical protein